MDFAMVVAYQPLEQLVPLARAAEEAGFRALCLADHVVDLETVATPYPYTSSGERRWSTDADWPDPWVTIGALSQATTRLQFFTSIYVAAMRNPFTVAKAVGTASALSGGRVALGVGVGWCREEFELLEQDFATRGRRTDEALALMRALWEPGWTEFAGEFYRCERLTMNPTPPRRVPVWVGGLSEVAMRRAARHDGWVGDMAKIDDAIEVAQRLRALRVEAGRDPDDPEQPFEVVSALLDGMRPEDFVRARRGGVTMTMTVPWMYYERQDAPLEAKLEGVARFGDDVLGPVRELLA
ncbi:TIGR03619 family F420-dependent LLM class oxidoreductase [Nocardioides sp. zg-536]|uniref:TIGR03619 family F420-dependent LLM class oxidoreductase n=1 Tax=Nocardioides faecalis TaxID=2803858 RepID=A0A938Y9A7_9ACTN|nr:TIGR03619 family F420-dependent LLM class oxidoreductase [Nocardioides faecalis]MBM9459831.1 TIGR03619 family F420-dependent LLM class oxidoreductase [Nocardioides faecalis]MBS4754462.1 TIGR03619 family F420-dependent LLM class oxidoreductase [Nocardioides faecalis]QVI58928.1 TIGR03619 family F420-dependent LLM class oxidoreductase [Nocardioides faecalis]